MFRLLAAIIRMALTLAFRPFSWLATASGWQPPVTALDVAEAELAAPSPSSPKLANGMPISDVAKEIKYRAQYLLKSERERENNPRENQVDLGPHTSWLHFMDKQRLRIVASMDLSTIESWLQTGIPEALLRPMPPAPAPAPQPPHVRLMASRDGSQSGGQKAKPASETAAPGEIDLDEWFEDLQRSYGGPRR